jgi:hypothetical protein
MTRLFRLLLIIAVPLALVLAVSAFASPAVAAASSPPSVPGPPVNVSAVAGNARAWVTWQPPVGSSGITSYVVTSVPGARQATVTGRAQRAVVTGLSNGTSYRFYVTAENAAGTSAPSASSAPVTPAAPTAPAAPVISDVLAQDGAIQLSWTPPDTGATGLIRYLIAVYSGGKFRGVLREPPSATTATVYGLRNGTDYVFTVTAVNFVGASPASPPSAATAPQPATPPMTPANVQAFPGDHAIQVAWSAPPDDGSPIRYYQVRLTPGGRTTVTGPGTTVATFFFLPNGTAFTAAVTAVNVAGPGPTGTASPVTPERFIVPDAPQNLSAASAGKGTASLQWSPPTTSGTSPIISYTVTASPGRNTVTSDDCSGTPVVCSATMSGLTATTAYTFTVAATNEAGTGSASAASTPVTPDTVIKQAPVVLSAASVATLRDEGSDGTLLFEQPPGQVTALTVGQIVEIAPTTAAPDGFLGRVSSTGSQGGLFVVYTTPASLDDVYSSYDAALNVPFAPASTQAMPSGVGLDPPTLNGKALPVFGGKALPATTVGPDDVSISWQGGGLVLSVDENLLSGDSEQGDSDSDSAKPEPTAELSGSLTLTPIFHVDDSNGFVDVTAGGSAQLSVEEKLGVQQKSDVTKHLFTIPGATIYTEIGPIQPLLTVALVLHTDGTVGVTLGASFNVTVTATCRIRKSLSSTSGDSCKPNAVAAGTETNQNLYGNMEVKGGVQLGGVVKMEWGALEIGDLVTPMGVISTDITANPWWTLSLEVDLGVYVKLFGFTLYENDDILTYTHTLLTAGGPLTTLSITPPSVQTVAPGTSKSYHTRLDPCSAADTSWQVIGGQGTVVNGIYTAPANFIGTAVIQATCNGQTGRVGVVAAGLTEPVLNSDTRGLVDGLVASWDPPPADSRQPDSYVVSVFLLSGPATSLGDYVQETVKAPATYAYIPGLPTGTQFSVLVTAVAGNVTTGEAEAFSTTSPTVTVLDRLPLELAGISFDGDIAYDRGSGTPDEVGVAGRGGAVVSGSGDYAFFYTEGRSNLAPAPVDVDDENVYLMREDLSDGTVQYASYATDGKPTDVRTEASPASTGITFPGLLATNDTGDAVAYVAANGQTLVHNFSSGATWAAGSPPKGTITEPRGLSDDAAVVTYTQVAPGNPVTYLDAYRQQQGKAPHLIGKCDCFNGNLSMSGSGDLIAYVPPRVPATNPYSVYLYDASTGKNSNLFPVNTTERQSLLSPVISDDGTRIAVQVAAPCPGSCQPGIAIKTLTSKGTSTTVTKADINVPATTGITDVPVSLTNGGTALAYALFNSATGAGRFQVYRSGRSVIAPALSTTSPQTAQLTVNGSELFYTLAIGGTSYPGVFEWVLG